MALIILPIGLILGVLLGDARRASWVTFGLGLTALLVLSFISASGVEVSPLETLTLIVGTPLAMLLARAGARLRRRSSRVNTR